MIRCWILRCISFSVLFFLLYCYEGAFSHDRKVPSDLGPRTQEHLRQPSPPSQLVVPPGTPAASFEVRLDEMCWSLWWNMTVGHFWLWAKTQVAGKGLLSKRINMIFNLKRVCKSQWCIVRCFSLKGLVLKSSTSPYDQNNMSLVLLSTLLRVYDLGRVFRV